MFPIIAGTILLALFSTTKMIHITDILSTCVDSCLLGCGEIRRVQQKRASTGSDGFKVHFKDPNDARSVLTEADGAAQRAIISSLRSTWGNNLKIVGEEEDDEAAGSVDHCATLRRDLLSIDSDREVDISRLTLFVDPVDGTREFVEGRLQNCQCLIGITIDDEPIAGAIGIPFPNGDMSTPSTILYGLVGKGTGCIGEPLKDVSRDEGDKVPRLGTGDSESPAIKAAREVVINDFHGINHLFSGAGNKILATARGVIDCTVQHKYGGPWDTCAPQALLIAMGGTITDMYGDTIQVYSNHKRAKLGYVATNANSRIRHQDLIKALQTKPALLQQRQEANF